MKIKMFLLSAILVLCLLFCSCTDNASKIVGTYMLGGAVYTFTPEGKILMENELDSSSMYEVKGNKIKMFNADEKQNALEFSYSFDGEDLVIGTGDRKAVYTRVNDVDEKSESVN